MTVYPGAEPLETDILLTNRNAMVALGWLAQDLMGAVPQIFGAACTGGAGLSVSVAPGRIYALAPLEATQWSSLPADTTDTCIKQGILSTAVSLACPAPTIAGDSIVYLVEGQYQDLDEAAATLSYWNATNPDQPFSGAGNNGEAQPTIRAGIFAIQIIPGVAAATGSAVAPNATAGWVAMYTVTVPYGAGSANAIATVSGAPINTGSAYATQAFVTAQASAAQAAATTAAETYAAAQASAAQSAAISAAATAAASAISANGPVFRVGNFSCINGTASVTFATAFPNACTGVVVMPDYASPDVGTDTGAPTKTGFQYTNGNAGNCFYIAWGN